MTSRKKKLMHVGIGILATLIFIMIIIIMFMSSIVQSTINTAGPVVLGVDVKLKDAQFRPLRGLAKFEELFIGNPEGFNAPSLCEAKTIRAKIDPSSILSDTLIIEEIYIDGPVFTYQKSLTKSNLSAFMDNLEGEKDSKSEKKKDKAKKGGERKVVIKDLKIEHAKVNLNIKGLKAGIPIPLPTIHLTDIGTESGGASVSDVVQEVFGAVFKSISNAVKASINVTGKGAEVATDTTKAVGKGVKKVTEGLKGLLKK